MSFNMSWDVEKYYKPYEPPEHWELKKKFMEVNKGKFPEERVVTLATAFINIEVLGCSYNTQLMKLIEELSKGVVEEYRECKKMKLQKVFVKASDAAASKVKGETAVTSSSNASVTAAPETPDVLIIAEKEKLPSAAADAGKSAPNADNKREKLEGPHSELKTRNTKRKRVKEKQKLEIPEECKTCYGNLVLIEDEGPHVLARQIIERSASVCQAKLTVGEETDDKHATTVTVSIRGIKVASATDILKKKAREMAYELALRKLQEVCYTVKVKRRFCCDQPVGRDFTDHDTGVQKEESHSTPASESIALKMMANMGWTGGGLGKAQQGITEPISVKAKVNRSGLGIKPKEGKKKESEFHKWAVELLQNYSANNSEQDLVFTTEYSNEERKILHQLCPRFELKSRSYGKQAGRHLVISKKIEPFATTKLLLTPGYQSEKYELIKPTCPKDK